MNRASYIKTVRADEPVQVWLDGKTIRWLKSQPGDDLGHKAAIALTKYQKVQRYSTRSSGDQGRDNLIRENNALRARLNAVAAAAVKKSNGGSPHE